MRHPARIIEDITETGPVRPLSNTGAAEIQDVLDTEHGGRNGEDPDVVACQYSGKPRQHLRRLWTRAYDKSPGNPAPEDRQPCRVIQPEGYGFIQYSFSERGE